MIRRIGRGGAAALLAALVVAALAAGGAQAQDRSRFFPETGHTISGRFLQYWEDHGGLAQQGYPLTDEVREVSETNGQTYTVQYFERAIFERHPEYAPPNDVLLTLLGVFEAQRRYGAAGPPDQRVSTDNPVYFAETKHTVGGKFRAYWESHGGLAQQGYPITDEFTEVSALNGKPYTVQYFQRAVFELHPEYAGSPFEVLLSQLGTFRYRARYGTLPLPGPGQGHLQSRPVGADRYLLWQEDSNHGDGAIYGLDLLTGQALIVAGGPGDQMTSPAVGGARAAWVQPGACPTSPCGTVIATRLLPNGGILTLTSGPDNARDPAVAGERIAWVVDRGAGPALYLRGQDAGAPKIVADAPAGARIGRPLLSNTFLVWTETDPAAPGATRDLIRSYDLSSAGTRTVGSAPTGLPMALDGAQLVWTDGQRVTLTNLASTKSLDLPAGVRPGALHGDTLVWSAPAGPDAPADLDIWGMRVPNGPVLRLVHDSGNQVAPTLAGDWLVWVQADLDAAGGLRGRLQSTGLARAFIDAGQGAAGSPTPAASPTANAPVPGASATAGPDVRLVANRALGRPGGGAGTRVFYALDARPPGNPATPAPGGTPIPDAALYMTDITTRQTTLIKHLRAERVDLVSDGRMAAWVERQGPQIMSIHTYDGATGLETVALPDTDFHIITDLAVDGPTLYYHDAMMNHLGLWERNIVTGVEQQVAALGGAPVAAEGRLLWTEPPDLSPGSQYKLHLLRHDSHTDQVIAQGPAEFSGYDVAGDNVVWAEAAPAPDRRVFLYTISAGATRPLTSGPALNPLIGGGLVAWTVGPSAPTPLPPWSVQTMNLASGATVTVADRVVAHTEAWAIIGGQAVAFTVNDPPVADLYVFGVRP